MSLKNRLERARRKALEFQKQKAEKMFEKNITPYKLLIYFNNLVIQNYNSYPVHSKKTKQMVSGLIKFLKNNGFSDKQIYDWIKEIVENWDKYSNKTCTTDKGKEYKINIYPNLDDIIYCKKFFLYHDIAHECNLDKEEEVDYNIWRNAK